MSRVRSPSRANREPMVRQTVMAPSERWVLHGTTELPKQVVLEVGINGGRGFGGREQRRLRRNGAVRCART